MLNFQQKGKNMEKYFEILKKCPLFFGVSDDELRALLHCLNVKIDRFDSKYTIFPEGSAAKYIGIVLSGGVMTVTCDYYGNRSILSEAGVSELFGEEFACGEHGSIPVSVIASEPCEVMLVDCMKVLSSCSHSCRHHHMMIYNLMRELADKNIMFHEKMEITSKRTTRDKLMAYLLLQAKKAKKSRFDIPFDRQELADYLEVDRSGLSSEIGKLSREGVIKSERQHFELL